MKQKSSDASDVLRGGVRTHLHDVAPRACKVGGAFCVIQTRVHLGLMILCRKASSPNALIIADPHSHGSPLAPSRQKTTLAFSRIHIYIRNMPTIPRLFVTSDLGEDAAVSLDEAQGKYLTRVLRHGIGDEVCIFNGRDGEWRAVIDSVVGRAVSLKTVAHRRVQPDAKADLTLAFAPLKKTRTDFVIEKATELGVTVIQPVITARTQTARIRTDRLQKIALEAAEQTERMDLPAIRVPLSFAAFLEADGESHTVFFCDEAGGAQPMRGVLETALPGPSAILIGPEGGFTPEERAQLHALDFVRPVTLGPNILRAETAAIAALTLWQAVLGDWA